MVNTEIKHDKKKVSILIPCHNEELSTPPYMGS